MIKSFSKTTILLIILGKIFIGIIVIKIIFPSRQKPSPTNIPQINQITPGQTTLDQLENLPQKFGTLQKDDATQILVGQNQPNSYSTINLQNNKVASVIINNQSQFEFLTITEYQ